MASDKMCFWYIKLYEFKKGVNAAKHSRNICNVFGTNAVTEGTCQFWFKKFCSGNFNLSNKPHSGRPSMVGEQVLKQMVTENPRQTSQELTERLNADHSTVLDHLHNLKMVSKLDVWVPPKLSEKKN
jgi:histone-lysine N-methyltransferase SETMAR